MRTLFGILLCTLATSLVFAQSSDAALRRVIEADRAAAGANGSMPSLTAQEHLERGRVYFDNRHFREAREHFQRIFDNFPNDAALSGALFMTGRSLMWERRCEEAIPWLDRVAKEYPGTKEGREGLAFKGACHVRIGKNAEAAAVYEQYTAMYPTGERIDSAYLNIVDAHREAGNFDLAAEWVRRTSERFPSTPTETNALHALVRMELWRGRWSNAEAAADRLIVSGKFAGSMTSMDEARWLKAFAAEKGGDRERSKAAYSQIPISVSSYFSGLAANKISGESRTRRIVQVSPKMRQDFPIMFREEIMRATRGRNVDPRFVLAIMKQESGFRPGVKSPAAARGLLQLVYDTAVKYNKKTGITELAPDDLYIPSVNIAIGVEYIADLKNQFSGLYEAIAASYNAGEDNAARWLKRSMRGEPGIFTAEVGFAETKGYVQKVMANYRNYRELYDENLRPR
ncbi:MAG: transglycosylase SLT domain-containing protein [Acidobacteriota bacterium]|nr:MAG: transglycosylase SLT domain-containing protein [Acidobacteriota bacterium]